MVRTSSVSRPDTAEQHAHTTIQRATRYFLLQPTKAIIANVRPSPICRRDIFGRSIKGMIFISLIPMVILLHASHAIHHSMTPKQRSRQPVTDLSSQAQWMETLSSTHFLLTARMTLNG